MVKETGTVSQLTIENKSPHHLYVHAGDIVKGGKQDRTIPNTFTLAPGSGPMDVGAFCVESGRWSQRGNEELAAFASSMNVVNSVALKQAAQIRKSQAAVWSNAGAIQVGAGENVGAGGALQGGASPTSLQLTLENPDEKDKKSLPLAKNGFIQAMAEARDAAVKSEKLAAGNFNDFQIGDASVAVYNSGMIGGKTVKVSGNVSVKTDFAKPDAAGNLNAPLNDVLQILGNGRALQNTNPAPDARQIQPVR